MSEAAVLLAHGSDEDPEPSRLVESIADDVQRRTRVRDVGIAYVDQIPRLADALEVVEADSAVAVPVFTSDGYYVNEVLPRELPTGVEVTSPVGTHDLFTDVVMERGRRGAQLLESALESTGLVVVGHGTTRHGESGTTVHGVVEDIGGRDVFQEVAAVFLDQEPNVEDLTGDVDSEAAVVVPYFVADGPHATEDVPEAIGFEDTPVDPPQTEHVDGVDVTYTSAAFKHPATVDVVVERVQDAVELRQEVEP